MYPPTPFTPCVHRTHQRCFCVSPTMQNMHTRSVFGVWTDGFIFVLSLLDSILQQVNKVFLVLASTCHKKLNIPWSTVPNITLTAMMITLTAMSLSLDFFAWLKSCYDFLWLYRKFDCIIILPCFSNNIWFIYCMFSLKLYARFLGCIYSCMNWKL